MCKTLRGLKLLDSFSIEYLLRNLNKKIAAIIVRFAKIVKKLEISI